MNNKLIILVCVFVLNEFQLLAQQDSTSVLNVWIERGSAKTSYAIDLIYENLTEDTLWVNSEYFIDEFYAAKYIRVYSCKRVTLDSLDCNWGDSHGLNPQLISLSKERTLIILPKEKKILRMPLLHIYIDKEVYLEIRMFCKYKETSFFLTKTTNRIFFDKEPDEYQKYQMEKNRKRICNSKALFFQISNKSFKR